MDGIRNSNGTRLAYVVVALEGTCMREYTTWSKEKGIQKEMREEPMGYMVYFPRGHAIRLKDKAELAHYNLGGQPPMINIQGLQDPNSPLGRMLHSQDEKTRTSAYRDMEDMVVRLATAKTGNVLFPEQLTKGFGRRPDEQAAA